MSGEAGQVVLVEPVNDDEDDLDYRITLAEEAPQGWSVAWLFIGIAFILGLLLGGLFL